MPRVTALRSERAGRVAVQLDDAPWRTLPLEVVVRAGLRIGLELDRPRARILRRELRRHEALTVSSRALRHRDLSVRALERRLEQRAFAPAERAEAMETLKRAGVLDDRRFARSRAGALAGRGYGDAAIRFDLERRGIAAQLVDAVVSELEPEEVRAARVAATAGGGVRAARLLARRGFGADSIEAAAGDVAEMG